MSTIDLWKTLNPGDLVRIAHMPSEFSLPGYQLHHSTREIYQKLIDEKLILQIRNIDEFGCPWIEYNFISEKGKEHHALMLNHDGVEVVSRAPQ